MNLLKGFLIVLVMLIGNNFNSTIADAGSIPENYGSLRLGGACTTKVEKGDFFKDGQKSYGVCYEGRLGYITVLLSPEKYKIGNLRDHFNKLTNSTPEISGIYRDGFYWSSSDNIYGLGVLSSMDYSLCNMEPMSGPKGEVEVCLIATLENSRKNYPRRTLDLTEQVNYDADVLPVGTAYISVLAIDNEIRQNANEAVLHSLKEKLKEKTKGLQKLFN
jgi:hypothetical protein